MTAAKVLDIISTESDVPRCELSEDQSFTSMKMDSLDYLNVLLKLEERTGVQIPAGSSARFKTAADVAEWISQRCTN